MFIKEILPAIKQADKQALQERIKTFKRTGALTAHAIRTKQVKAEKAYKLFAPEKEKNLPVENWSNKNRSIAFSWADTSGNLAEQVLLKLNN